MSRRPLVLAYHGLARVPRALDPTGLMLPPEEFDVRVMAPRPWFPLLGSLRPGLRPEVPEEEVQTDVVQRTPVGDARVNGSYTSELLGFV